MSYIADYRISQRDAIVNASFETLDELISELGSMHKPGFELCFVYEDGERMPNEEFVDVVVAMMIAYVKFDAAKRLESYAHSGLGTDELVEEALYKRYGQSPTIEEDCEIETPDMKDKNDITHLLERLEAFEERCGIRIDALSAHLDDDFNDGRFAVRGEIHPREGVQLKHSIFICVVAYDNLGRVVNCPNETLDAEHFFGFAPFAIQVHPPAGKISKIRVFPRIRPY